MVLNNIFNNISCPQKKYIYFCIRKQFASMMDSFCDMGKQKKVLQVTEEKSVFITASSVPFVCSFRPLLSQLLNGEEGGRTFTGARKWPKNVRLIDDTRIVPCFIRTSIKNWTHDSAVTIFL